MKAATYNRNPNTTLSFAPTQPQRPTTLQTLTRRSAARAHTHNSTRPTPSCPTPEALHTHTCRHTAPRSPAERVAYKHTPLRGPCIPPHLYVQSVLAMALTKGANGGLGVADGPHGGRHRKHEPLDVLIGQQTSTCRGVTQRAMHQGDVTQPRIGLCVD